MLCAKRLFNVSPTIILQTKRHCSFSYTRKLRLEEVKLFLARLNNPNKLGIYFSRVFSSWSLHLTLQLYISSCLLSPSTSRFLITLHTLLPCSGVACPLHHVFCTNNLLLCLWDWVQESLLHFPSGNKVYCLWTKRYNACSAVTMVSSTSTYWTRLSDFHFISIPFYLILTTLFEAYVVTYFTTLRKMEWIA